MFDNTRFLGLAFGCRARNIKLNKEKFQFKSSEVSFIGHVMTKDGLKADPKKVEAVIKME